MNMTPEQRLALLMGAGAPAPLAPAPATPSAFTVPEGTFYTPAQADALSRALAPLASCYVSVLGSAFIKSVQKGVTPAQAGRFMSLVDALTKRHGTDAHVQPAYAPKLVEGAGDGTSYRLSGDTPAHMGVRVDALLLDWDTPDHAPWGEADFGAVARELADCPRALGCRDLQDPRGLARGAPARQALRGARPSRQGLDRAL